MTKSIKEQINNFYDKDQNDFKDSQQWKEIFQQLIQGLNTGKIRSAEPDGQVWKVNEWVKKGIIIGFRTGELTDMSSDRFPYFDKSTYPLKRVQIKNNIRIVPGGTSIRQGCYISPGVVMMPPCYVNVGAYVDKATMLDSHSLIGSCAQVGKNCHVSAAAQIGGVLEPVNARPVIIEDNVLIGGNCGIYEGVLIKKNAILASGVIITSSTPVYDLIKEQVYKTTASNPLTIPENSVVVPGSRPASGEFARKKAISLHTPVIVKYRDASSNAKTALEEALRKI
ncbi:MAG: 2,3,4,5-tetrahydropyridine-2,6-dicarboxylate N-succinyltransferase [bacterium]